MQQHPFLIIPRNDGVAVSVDGNLHIKEMNSREMLTLAGRCFEAAMEMLKEEEHAKDNTNVRASDIGPAKSKPDVTR